MREHASEGNESAQDAESPGHLQSGLTEGSGTPGRSLSIAQVAMLQRTAGNAAVARALQAGRAPSTNGGPTARGVIQREISTRPEHVDTFMKPNIGVSILDRIKGHLKTYHTSRSPDLRFAMVERMLEAVGEWLSEYEGTEEKIAGARRGTKAKFRVEQFKKELVRELGATQQQSEYLRDMAARKFGWASFESGGHVRSTAGEVGAAADLAKGVARPHGAATGTGEEALELVEKYNLTEAELLGIKVYAVGDYKTINPTLAGDETWLKKSLPYLQGLPDPDPANPAHWLLPPEKEPDDPALLQKWKAYVAKFDVLKVPWVAALTKLDLSNVDAEARRHAQHAESGLMKLPAVGGRVTYRGEQLTQAQYDAMYPGANHVRSEKYFLSTSKDRDQAERYAEGAKANGKLGILLECTLTGKSARDIEKLVVHPGEREVLLLPGARLRIKRIKPPPPGKAYDRLIKVTEE